MTRKPGLLLLLLPILLGTAGCSPQSPLPALPLQLSLNRMGTRTFETTIPTQFKAENSNRLVLLPGASVTYTVPYQKIKLGGDDVSYSNLWLNATGMEIVIRGRIKHLQNGWTADSVIKIHDRGLSARLNRDQYSLRQESLLGSTGNVEVDINYWIPGEPDLVKQYEARVADWFHGGPFTYDSDLTGWIKDRAIPGLESGFRAANMLTYPVIQSEYADLQGGYFDDTHGAPNSPNTGVACDREHAVEPTDTPTERGCAFIKSNVDLKKPYSQLTAQMKIMVQKRPGVTANTPGAWLKLPPPPGRAQETWITVTAAMVPKDRTWYTFRVPFDVGGRRALPYVKFLMNLNANTQEKRFAFDWAKVDYVRFYENGAKIKGKRAVAQVIKSNAKG